MDDDGQPQRAGTFWTASAHIITAVIGSGVLSLAWAIAQLGWVAGPAAMLLFAFVTYYTATLLAECYRTGDPETGKRNYTYMDAVRSNLGGAKVAFCGVIQYANLVGVAIGYTIAASISMLYVINNALCSLLASINQSINLHASISISSSEFAGRLRGRTASTPRATGTRAGAPATRT